MAGTEGNPYAGPTILIISMFFTVLFSILACMVMTIVTAHSSNTTKAVSDLGMSVAVFGAMVAVLGLGFCAWTLKFKFTTRIGIGAVLLMVLQTTMLCAFAADMDLKWYASDKNEEKNGSMALLILLYVGTIALFLVTFFGGISMLRQAYKAKLGLSKSAELSSAQMAAFNPMQAMFGLPMYVSPIPMAYASPGVGYSPAARRSSVQIEEVQ